MVIECQWSPMPTAVGNSRSCPKTSPDVHAPVTHQRVRYPAGTNQAVLVGPMSLDCWLAQEEAALCQPHELTAWHRWRGGGVWPEVDWFKGLNGSRLTTTNELNTTIQLDKLLTNRRSLRRWEWEGRRSNRFNQRGTEIDWNGGCFSSVDSHMSERTDSRMEDSNKMLEKKVAIHWRK